jgi:aldose 1-epimerase
MDPEVASGRQFVLVHDTQRAVVAQTGATLRSWRVDGRPLLDPPPAGAAIDRGYRGKVLMPWPNRVRDGRYAFGGVDHGLAVDERDRGHALHGLALWADWMPVRCTEAAVTLELHLRPRPGFPFALVLEARYELSGDGLAVTLGALNVGDGPAPFGAGLHPYFAASGDRVDEDVLQLPAATRLAVDERLLPTGKRVPVAGSAHDLRAPGTLGQLVLDDCFTDLERGADGLARVRLAGGGRELTLWLDEAFGFLQVFTGDTLPADQRRRAVAIEPMTCAPDAFNSGDGLLVLAPGERFRGRFGVHADVA